LSDTEGSPSRRDLEWPSHVSVGRPFTRNRPLQWLVGAYVLVWIWSGVAPIDRSTWVLENMLVVGLVLVLLVVHRRFRFSTFSNLSIFCFLLLHAVGSHYTYSAVPIGDWVRDAFELSRNHYDRFVHFAFGLLVAYPLREITLRSVHARGIWSYLGPLMATLALSSVYEIIEWVAARASDPAVGIAYVGAQGDIWDGQKDMTLAFAGACIAMAACALYRRLGGREPYLLLEA